MTLVESYLTKNDCYKAGKKITPKGLMLHSVGTPQPGAKVFVNNWNRPGIEKCVHAFIDANDGKVYQTLPWNHRGWHGGGSSNNTHIGVEMCEPSQIKYTGGANFKLIGEKADAVAAAERTYKSAVELFAQLCVKYKLNPLTDIVSHSEGHAKGIASNHGDPVHLWKGLGLSYTMDGFRKEVAEQVAKIGGAIPSSPTIAPAPTPAPSVSNSTATAPSVSNSTATAPSVSNEKKIRIDVDNLRIRKDPCVGDNFTGKYTGKGIFTITEIQNGSGSTKGWGKLKSGAGWVSLDHVVML